jgi:ABC-2 type transport system permease protein
VSEAAQTQGRVFDLGFRRYEGPREGRRRAFLSVYKDGLRTSLGIGRGTRAKVLPWVFIGTLLVVAAILALIAGAVDRLAADFNAEDDLPSHADFYGFAIIVLLLFAAVVGPELFCPDRRDGVISLYLVRPLRALDYLAARWAALVTVTIVAAWLPQLFLLAGLTLGGSEPGTYLADHWLDVPRFLVAGLALAVYVATLGTLVASFTTRRAYAAAFLVGLFVVSTGVITSVAEAVRLEIGRWIALLSIRDVPLLINDLVFGGESTLGADEAANLPGAIQVGWYFLVVGLALAVIWRHSKRLSV